MASNWDIFSGSEPWENGDGFRKIYSSLEIKCSLNCWVLQPNVIETTPCGFGKEFAMTLHISTNKDPPLTDKLRINSDSTQSVDSGDRVKYSSSTPPKIESNTKNLAGNEKLRETSSFDVYESNCCSVTSYAGVLSTKNLNKTESVFQLVVPETKTSSEQLPYIKENFGLDPKRKRLPQKKRSKKKVEVKQQCLMQEQEKIFQFKVPQSYIQRSVPSEYYTFGTMHLEEHGEVHPYVGMERKREVVKVRRRRNRKSRKAGIELTDAQKIDSKMVDEDGFENVGKKKRARSIKSSEVSKVAQRTRFQEIDKFLEDGERVSEFVGKLDCHETNTSSSPNGKEKKNQKKKTCDQSHATHFDYYKKTIQIALQNSQDRDIHLLAPRYFGFFETLKKKLRLDYYDRIAKNSSNAEFRNSIVFLRSITTTSIFDSIEKMFLEKYTHFPPPSSYDYFYSAVSYFLP